MIKSIICLVALFYSIHSFGQKGRKDINLIIVIDDKISIGSISNLKILIPPADENKYILPVEYYPGALLIDSVDFNTIKASEFDYFLFNFIYYEYQGNRQKVYQYSIRFEKIWLKDSFLILRIFNLNKQKNKNKLKKPKPIKYVYELESPSFTFKLVPQTK